LAPGRAEAPGGAEGLVFVAGTVWSRVDLGGS